MEFWGWDCKRAIMPTLDPPTSLNVIFWSLLSVTLKEVKDSWRVLVAMLKRLWVLQGCYLDPKTTYDHCLCSLFKGVGPLFLNIIVRVVVCLKVFLKFALLAPVC